MGGLFASHGKRVVALTVVAGLYWTTRLPTVDESERARLASQFRFTSQPLAEVAGGAPRTVRPVHPSLKHIAAWISSVGASIALCDLDGDGLANDVCYVDTRTDQVIAAPVPQSGDRYAAFTLDPGPEQFDRNTMCPTGCVPGDLNEDGLMDVLVYYWGRPPIAFLRRDEANATDLHRESFAVCEIAPRDERWYTNAATRADVDGDGHADLLIGNYFQDGARILDAEADGAEQMQHSMSRAFNGGRSRVLLWAGASRGSAPSVTFREAEGVLDVDGEQVSTGWTLSLAAADLDGDQLPELYLGHDFGPDRLLHNRSRPGRPRFALLNGRRTWSTPASKVLGNDSFKGMGCDFGDVNGDGILDIYVSNIAAEYALEESHFLFVSTGDAAAMQQGTAPYHEESERLGVSRSGWGWDSRLADFNNDGVLEAVQATGFARGDKDRWPELHEIAMGNDQLLSNPGNWHRFEPGDDLSGHEHNPFFVRAGDGRFYDIAVDVGLGAPHVTRGIATADVDGDGDLDFAVGNQWEPSILVRNGCPAPGRFLGLRLMLPVDRSPQAQTVVYPAGLPRGIRAYPAIGAAATVILPGSERRLVAQVDGGNGHSGSRSPELHFGLGDLPADKKVEVELQWRDAAGDRHRETLQLSPGWYTVVLKTEQN